MLFEDRIKGYAPFFSEWEPVRVISASENTAVLELRREKDGADERCALKAVRLGAEAETEVPAEVQSMILLSGKPNIVRCFEYEMKPAGEDGETDLLIREELLTSVRDMQKSGFVFDEKETEKLCRDICAALQACAEAGIVHGDIKPGNIFRDAEGRYKLGDFGSAKPTSDDERACRVTDAYAAPEQVGVIPGRADARTDIYGLGLTLYELVNGNRLPFAKSPFLEIGEIKRRLLGEALPAADGASASLNAVLLKACAFRPQDRFGSAEELLAALDRADGSGAGKSRLRFLFYALAALAAAAAAFFALRPAFEKPAAPVSGGLPNAQAGSAVLAETTPEATESVTEVPTAAPTEAPTPNPDDPVEFNNAEFEAMAREQLGLSGEVTYRDLRSCAHLVVGSSCDWESGDLSDIAKFKNLESLEIYYANDPDLSCLEGLDNLNYLEVSECGLKSFSSLPELPALKTLYIRSNAIADLSGAERFTGLTFLDISYNSITDLAPVTALQNLKTLAITGNRISDLSALAELPSLRDLVMNGNPASDLSALAPILPELRSLRADRCGLTDISALAACRELHTLSAEDNSIGDISVLFTLPKLYYCFLGGNPVPQDALARLEAVTQTHIDPME